MVGAGLLAKKAVERGLDRKPWVKSSLAPGSKVVTRVLRQGRPDAVPRGARLPHGRLRLHDLHRQLGAAAGAGLAGDRGGRPRRLRRALGQPELRGARPPRGEGELPRDPAARRRLCARRPDGPRPRDRAARSRTRTASRSSSPTSGPPPRRCARRSTARSAREMFERTYADVYTGDPAWRELPVPEGYLFAWDDASTYVRRPPYFDGMPASRGRRGRRRRTLPRLARRLGHDRPHLARRVDQARLARPAATSSSTGSSGATSTPTARAAATTR